MNDSPHRSAGRRGALMAMAALMLLAAAEEVPAAAADMPPAMALAPMLDPWVPQPARTPSTSEPTQGIALREQVERKLRQTFHAADIDRSGTLTRAQANAAGLGYITRHFDEIDRQKAGAVRFDDVKRFLRERGAQLN